MASGRTHDNLCFVGAAVSVAGATLLNWPVILALVAGAGSLSGTILSPDLDLVSGPYNRWDRAGLGWVWRPYKNSIRHRRVLSHLPVLGTAVRLLWLFYRLFGTILIATAALIFIQSVAFEGALDPYLLQIYRALPPIESLEMVGWVALEFFAAYFAGLCVADTFHWVADGCPVRL